MDFYSMKWDTIQKTKYRAEAGITVAREELDCRLEDRVEIPLPGIHGEKLYLTGYSPLLQKAESLELLYNKLPKRRGVQEYVILEAWSSAAIEGARTTVEQVKQSILDPKTKDDRMVVNGIVGGKYAYGRPITSENIRRLWDRIVDGVCENEDAKGDKYRNGMVYIGSDDRTIHAPAQPEQLPELMDKWFAYCQGDSIPLLIRSFVAHFYFVYLHPFCDGNGRTARILNASQLYHGGYKKMRSLSLATAINRRLQGYYGSLSDGEILQKDPETGKLDKPWLDLSPFVAYMLDTFEQCLTDAALSKNILTEKERAILERMNKVGQNAEITYRKAAEILKSSLTTAGAVLKSLAQKGYLEADTSKQPHIYRLQQHFVD